MLCLADTIHDDDPAWQHLLRAVDDASSLKAIILGGVAGRPLPHGAPRRSRVGRPGASAIFLAPLPCVRAAPAKQGFGDASDHQPVWPASVAVSGGPVSSGLCDPAGAPLDDALGVQPSQRTSQELQALGCALAVFTPFATAAQLLGWYRGGTVSPRAVWCWVPTAGQRAMEQLHAQLQALAQGHLPPEEPLAADLAAAPLLLEPMG